MGKILKGLLWLVAIAWLGTAVWAYWPTGVEEVPARELAGPEDRFVDADGLAFRYREFGQRRPGEPSIVLLHGMANSLQTFRLLAPRLADDYHVLTVDMIGFGLSDKPADHDYHNPGQADAVIRFFRALGLSRVVIGGHSLGGTVALHVALRAPEVAGVIFMNPGLITTGVPAISEYLVWPFPRMSAKMFADRNFREDFLRRSFVKPEVVTDQVIDDIMLAVRSEGYMSGTTTMMGQYVSGEEVPLLPELTVPVLVVWGLLDKSKSEAELAQLRELMPDARVVTVDDAAHYVHEESPQATADAIIAAKDMWAAPRSAAR